MNSVTRRRITLVVLWFAGSVVAVSVAIAAIGLAGARVTGQSTMLRARDSAHHAAAVGVDPGSADSTSVPTSADGSAAGSGGATSSSEPRPLGPGATDGQFGSSPTTSGLRPGNSSKSSPGGSPATTAAPAPMPTTRPSSPSSSTSKAVSGGTVTVQCINDAASYVSGSPAPGYQIQVESRGPDEVEVRFASDAVDYEWSVKATCQAGVVTFTTTESGGGS
jgi:hypothetical protein